MALLNERIKERRMFCGLTLLEVANKIGVKEATVQRYESGKIKNIKYETILDLAHAFNCSPAYLMGFTDNPKDNFLDESEKQKPLISNNLIFLIKINRFSVNYLIKETGIDKETLEGILAGENDGLMLPGKKMMKLAGLFGLELDELYGQLPSRIYENFEPYSIDAIEVVNAYTQAPPYYKNSVRRILGLSDFHSEDISEDVKHA